MNSSLCAAPSDLHQSLNNAFIAMADANGKTTSIWCLKLPILSTTTSTVATEVHLQVPTQRKRNSVEEKDATVGDITTEETGSGMSLLRRRSLSTSPPPAIPPGSQKKGHSQEEDQLVLGREANFPPHVYMNSKVSQNTESIGRDMILLTEVYDLDGGSNSSLRHRLERQPQFMQQSPQRQHELQLLQVIGHDSLEATSMELRVSPLQSGGGNGNYSGVLYIGMSTGVVQKHTIREFY